MNRNILLNDKFILLIIVLNTLVIFLQGFNFQLDHISKIEYFDNLFTIIFILEMLSKLRYFGVKNYFSSNWNIFDFILVVIAIPSLISLMVPKDFINLDFLLAFRVLRIFKFFRFIRFIPNIDKIINGVYRASKASVLIIISFIIFNFTISLVSCFVFRNISPEYFSDPIVSFYSIFKVFTIEGWYEIPESLSSSTNSVYYSFLIKIYFIVILFFGGIFGLSLVNSIFVDSMISDNNDELENKIDELNLKVDKLLKKIDN